MAVTMRTRKRDGKTVRFYHAEVWIRGKRATSKSFDNRAEAYQWHDDEKRLRTIGFANPDIKTDYTLEDLVTEYRRVEEPTKRRSTVEADECRWKYFLDSPLANLPVTNINAMAIDHWFEWLHDHDCVKSYKRTSFLYELALFKTLLNWYRENKENGYVVPFLRRHKKRTKIPGKVSYRGKTNEFYMNVEDVKRWLEVLETMKNPIYLKLAHLMVGTGFRLGEACGLRWSPCIDFDNSTITIDRTLSWEQKTKRPYLQDEGEAKNTQSLRTIAMPEGLRIMLLEMKVKSRHRHFIFERDTGEALHYSTLYKAFSGSMEKAGIKFSGTHICRHTFATLALKVTGDLAKIQNVLGHISERQTKHYAKIAILNGNDTPQQVYGLFQNLGDSKKETPVSF